MFDLKVRDGIRVEYVDYSSYVVYVIREKSWEEWDDAFWGVIAIGYFGQVGERSLDRACLCRGRDFEGPIYFGAGSDYGCWNGASDKMQAAETGFAIHLRPEADLP